MDLSNQISKNKINNEMVLYNIDSNSTINLF